MKRIKKHIKNHHIISALAAGGIAFAAFNFNGTPLFNNLDNFVLFASEEIQIEQGTQVSSGDLGSNGKIDIEKDVIINGNLFANEITIDKDSTINGNASFNKLKPHKNSRILGTQTKPVQLPIANIPNVSEFQIGTQDFRFEGATNTLSVGSYRDIILEKNARLNLSGGAYNLRKLELKENSTFIFNGSTTINIQFKLKGKDRVSILPGQNIKPDDLTINYLGLRPRNEKEEKEDDDNEIDSEMDNQEKKDHKASKIGRPIVFGKNSFLNFKLLAPKASVHIGKESTVRGQILARKIKIEKNSILSREQTGFKIAKPEDIITDPDGGVYPINELLVSLTPEATILDAQTIAASVNGRIIGIVSSINLYQIGVPAGSIQELENLISILRSNPKVEGVFRNFVVPKQFFPVDRVETLSKIDNEFKIAPSVVYLIFATPMYRILFFAATLLLALYLYLKRHQLRKFSIIKDKLFYSSSHLAWFAVLSITFLLFPLTWLVRWIAPYGRGGSIGIPFITFGGSTYEFGFSIVGILGNILFVYILTLVVAYLKRNFRKHGSLIILLVLALLITGSIFLVFVRFVREGAPFMPSPILLRILGHEAYAAPQIKYDLENLRNQFPPFTKAYDNIKIQQAWEVITSVTPLLSPPIIGIVDFGVEATHHEFNTPEVNFGSVNRSLLEDFIESTFLDPVGGHGTQVAGIIGANNVSRINPLAQDSPQMNGILSGVLSENQYTLEFKPIGGPKNAATSTFIQVAGALEAAIGGSSRVVNMSFGGALCSALSIFSGRECYKTDQEFLDAFGVYQRQFQQASTTLFVAGAGNDDIDASHSLPGALSLLDNVMTVGATDLDDKRAEFLFPEKSNFGSSVNISAPGTDVYAPAPNNEYDSDFSGTSASAPMVTGVAGLLKALEPEYQKFTLGLVMNPAKIKEILIKSADPINTGELNKPLGKDCFNFNTFIHNGCRENAHRAVAWQFPPKSVENLTTSNITSSSIALNWTRSSDFDFQNPDFDSYKIFRSTTAGVNTSNTLIATITGSTTTSFVDSGLTPTTAFFYKVFVFDRAGLSSGSNEVSATTQPSVPSFPGPQPGPNVGDTISIPMLSGGILGIGTEMDITGVAVAADGVNAVVAESSGDLSRVNLATGQVTTIAFVSAGGIASPVIEPGGETVLVVTAPRGGGPSGGIARVNLTTGAVNTILASGIDHAAAMALDSQGRFAYVTGSEGGLFKIDLEARTVSVISGIGGFGLALESNNTTALVPAGGPAGGVFSCNLMRIDLVTGDVTPIASVCLFGGVPVSVAIEPGGQTALVATTGQFAGASGVIARVTLATGAVRTLSSCQGCGWPHLTMEPSGTSVLYLGDLDQSIIRFNIADNTQTTLARSDSPQGMALSSDGQTAFTVSDEFRFTSKLSRISLDTGKVDKLVTTGRAGGGIILGNGDTSAFFTALDPVNFSTPTIQKVDLSTLRASTTSVLPDFGHGIAREANGNTVLVAVNDGRSLLRVNLISGAVGLISDQLSSPVAVAVEEEGVSALVVEGRANVSLSRVDLQTGGVTVIASDLAAIGFGRIGGVAREPSGQTALAAIGGALIRVNLLSGALTTLAFPICGLGNGLSGVIIEGGGNTALLSHEVCGILRIRIR